jgi:hypothetical protein
VCRAYSRPDAAYRFLQPTFRFRRAGNPTGARDPRRDGDRNLLPFLQRAQLPPLRERGHAASRAPSVRSDLGVGSSRLPEFAQPRCRLERATFDGFRRRSVVTIDVHGSVDRVKDVICSLSSGSSPSTSSAYALWRMPMPCPSYGHHRTPFVSGESVGMGGSPLPTVDHRSRPVFRRRPAKSIAFPRTGVPFTVTSFSAESARRLLVSVTPRRPPAHAAPTFSPGWGEC